ncbi:N-acetylmuramoyl-L-alanine amidase [Carnobacterium gallinarum]|uniref:N-acetylmuramoyl-L-alanine amidase n=1 Tax=Carnobacterium gallinarum TaxID=2749 RepID=UPI00068BC8D5|nr:N-acetylmuramoyl-L-alanine amidase [Carnobacterium gallinarum]
MSKKKKNRKGRVIILNSFFKKIALLTVVILTVNSSFVPLLNTIVFAEENNKNSLNDSSFENAASTEMTNESINSELSSNSNVQESAITSSTDSVDSSISDSTEPIPNQEKSEPHTESDSIISEEKIDNSDISTKNYDAVMSDVLKRSPEVSTFINDISGNATKLAQGNDLYASVMIAQAVLESSYGTSQLGQVPVHNLFGIKGKYNGQSIVKESLEELPNGTIVSRKSEFRKYGSREQSQADYVEKIKKGPNTNAGDSSWSPTYYSGAWKSHTNSYKDATAALTGKYATDSSYGQKLNSVIEVYNLQKFDLPIQMMLDAPLDSEKVNGNQVVVQGWALAGTSVKEVNISVNGQAVGKATYGLERSDVNQAYSQYQNMNSGYTYTFNKSILNAGSNTLNVQVVSANNETKTIERKINNPVLTNRIYVERPVANEIVDKTLTIRGWALSPNKVSKIEVLIDGVSKLSFAPNVARPDVTAAFSEYPTQTPGFLSTVDTSGLTAGSHKVVVKMYDTAGSVSEQAIGITKQATATAPIINMIDTLSNGKQVSGNYQIRGWALAGGGIKNVEIQVDGKVQGNATYGTERLDVYTKFPQYANKNSGYSYVLDASKLTTGNHTIKVTAVANSGKIESQSFSVVKPDMPIKVYVDAPVEKATVINAVTVRGWALAESGVSAVNILVDGKVQGKATLGTSRPDVATAFPQYKESKAGYSYQLNTSTLSVGSHKLTVQVIDKNGTIKNSESTIVKPKADVINMIDTLSEGQIVSGKKTIRGWALAGEKLKNIEIYVDGKLQGNAVYGIERLDVYNKFPQYNNKNSGYNFTLDVDALTYGKHKVDVKVVLANGDSDTTSVNVEKSRLETRYTLENPKDLALVTDSVMISGWVLSSTKVKTIDVYVDNNKVGNANIGGARPDVANVFPEYLEKNAGFNYVLTTKNLANGKHSVKLVVTFEDKTTTTFGKEIYKASLATVGSIDSPSPNQLVGASQTVRGWILSEEGINSIRLLVDGVQKGMATTNLARPDVAAAFPDYKEKNAGYLGTISTAGLTNGTHTVTVIGTTNGGRVHTMTQKIVVGELSGKTVFVDAGHGGKDPGAIAGGVNEKDLNLSVALKVKANLEQKGATVVMSRSTDVFLELREIAAKANNSKADIFISLHHNSSSITSVSGIETYSYDGSGTRSYSAPIYRQDSFYSDITPNVANNDIGRIYESQQLAIKVQAGLIRNTGAVDREAKKTDFHVIRETNMPAILTELGFITSPAERAKLVNGNYQNQLAKGISDGAADYLRK